MRVYIGTYRTWIGPYQIASLAKYVGASADRIDKIEDWLSNTWICSLCNWINSKKTRKIKVKIHHYDTWNMDNTLALIIYPMLKQLQETTHGGSAIDDEDAPDDLKSTACPPPEEDYYEDANYFKRWDWAIAEMIWTFEQVNTDWEAQYHDKNNNIDRNGYDIHNARMQNGFRLFGKYYSALWD